MKLTDGHLLATVGMVTVGMLFVVIVILFVVIIGQAGEIDAAYERGLVECVPDTVIVYDNVDSVYFIKEWDRLGDSAIILRTVEVWNFKPQRTAETLTVMYGVDSMVDSMTGVDK